MTGNNVVWRFNARWIADEINEASAVETVFRFFENGVKRVRSSLSIEH